jgi:predicted ATP-binding protein involved in virulence
MYITKVSIKNIKSISQLTLTFPNPAGWHVIIGDNSSGKSTVVRAIALALLGKDEAMGLRADWREWLNKDEKEAQIMLQIRPEGEDIHTGRQARVKNKQILNGLSFKQKDNIVVFEAIDADKQNKEKNETLLNPQKYNWGTGPGWFSVAFGPFRRFSGGNSDWAKLFYAQPKLGAHLSVFGEDVALSEATVWLRDLNYKAIENKEGSQEAQKIIAAIITLINSEDFLPHQTKLHSISSDGVQFQDAKGAIVDVNSLSDGFRSILSLTFELLRQLVRVYGADKVFEQIYKSNMHILLSGIVIIDEIDAHLHPVWQTKIGYWFIKYFPNIQFIVTTHSPLICRAAEKGSIWRLAVGSNGADSGEVLGQDKDMLLHGNILDAYGTTLFGKEPVQRTAQAQEELKILTKLNMLAAFGKISPDEAQEHKELLKKYPTL